MLLNSANFNHNGGIDMNIITISREFGSGGREIGKRLADALGYTYYDKEIETEIARRMNMDVNYVEHALERGALMNIPLHFGKTLTGSVMLRQQVDILVEKQRIVKEIASHSNCIIVGRAADVILSEYDPFKIFVYADMDYKVDRCRKYAELKENLTDKEMEKAIKKIDSDRAGYHRLYTDTKWGKKENYSLCVNTTGLEIKNIIASIADYALCWFHNK